MNISERLRRDFHNDALANLKTLRSLVAAVDPPARALGLMGHIVGSQATWLSRLGHAYADMPVWPTLTLVECEQHLRRLADTWRSMLDQFDTERLDQRISYRNSSGAQWHNTVSDVLSHVLLHSAYHRGQIAMLIRDAGFVPVSTDLVAAARTGELDGPLPLPPTGSD